MSAAIRCDAPPVEPRAIPPETESPSANALLDFEAVLSSELESVRDGCEGSDSPAPEKPAEPSRELESAAFYACAPILFPDPVIAVERAASPAGFEPARDVKQPATANADAPMAACDEGIDPAIVRATQEFAPAGPPEMKQVFPSLEPAIQEQRAHFAAGKGKSRGKPDGMLAAQRQEMSASSLNEMEHRSLHEPNGSRQADPAGFLPDSGSGRGPEPIDLKRAEDSRVNPAENAGIGLEMKERGAVRHLPSLDFIEPRRPVEQTTLEAIRGHIQLLRSSGQDRLEVVLRPSASTELFLQVAIRDGQIAIHARCDRGEFGVLAAHWGEIQSALAAQGVRVEPLQAGLAATPRQDFSFADPRRHPGGREDDGAFLFEQDELIPAGARAKSSADSGPVKGWQRWA